MLAFPTAALAATSEHGGKPPAGTMFVLRGTLTVPYVAATTTTPGSVSILVSRSNHENMLLKGQTLVFATGPGSHVKLPKGGSKAGDIAFVDVRALGDSSVLALEAATPSVVIDQGQPQVLFILRGTLEAVSKPGAVSITVKSSNHEGSLLKSAPQPLSFVTSSKTKVVLHDGVFTSGDKGIVKIRAAKNASVATLMADTAFQVIDQG
ncbi:MAG TPA: hypothetical protein VKR27_02735 [Acidimicrobiales bacterium]|nr:hypothetical protein [Acidimicrobiales bacterium]